MGEIKNLSDVKQSGLFGTSNFDNVINNSLQVLTEHPELVSEKRMDIGDTPISPMTLDGDYTHTRNSQRIFICFIRKIWNIG